MVVNMALDIPYSDGIYCYSCSLVRKVLWIADALMGAPSEDGYCDLCDLVIFLHIVP